MTQEEMQARMETLYRERQAGKETAGADVDPTVAQNWAAGVKSGSYKITDVPKQYKNIVVRMLGPDVKPPAKMSGAERKDVDESKALIQQINEDILPTLEGIKNINQPGYFAGSRLGYGIGLQTKYSDLISFSERLKAVSSRLLAGGRMSQQMYSKLTAHLPNFLIDSPSLAYSKLTDARKTLQEQINAMQSGSTTTTGSEGASLPQGGGKALTDPAIAQQFHQATGGDKDQARRLATEAGWQIPTVQ